MFYIKDEGLLDDNGQLIGPLYHNDEPVFTDGRWVNYVQAKLIANKAGEDIEII